MNMENKVMRHSLWALAAVAISLAGCSSGVSDPETSVTGSNKYADTLDKSRPADAGVALGTNPSQGLPDTVTQAKTMAFTSRNDPFSLTGSELAFDRSQAAERLNSEFGGFGQEYNDTSDEVVEQPQLQPKPAWRLSGIIISEGGVIGLLDMGGEVIQIRPGMTIPNQPYAVVSIDSQRAVLRRTDGQLPRTIQVDLSGPVGGGSAPQQGGFGGPPAGGGAPGFGAPARPGRPGGGGGAIGAGN